MISCSDRCMDVVLFLLQKKVNPFTKNKEGKTAKDQIQSNFRNGLDSICLAIMGEYEGIYLQLVLNYQQM